MKRPLSRSDLAALIAETLTPVPPPDPIDEILGREDAEREAVAARILAKVRPATIYPPIRLSREGFQRLPSMSRPPSHARPFRTWRCDLNEHRREDVENACPIPVEWEGGSPRRHTPVYWHGQYVPANGFRWPVYVRWRRILPFPSTAGAPPVTLDDLITQVDARRAEKANRPPIPRGNLRDFLPAWAVQAEAVRDRLRSQGATR